MGWKNGCGCGCGRWWRSCNGWRNRWNWNGLLIRLLFWRGFCILFGLLFCLLEDRRNRWQRWICFGGGGGASFLHCREWCLLPYRRLVSAEWCLPARRAAAGRRRSGDRGRVSLSLNSVEESGRASGGGTGTAEVSTCRFNSSRSRRRPSLISMLRFVSFRSCWRRMRSRQSR